MVRLLIFAWIFIRRASTPPWRCRLQSICRPVFPSSPSLTSPPHPPLASPPHLLCPQEIFHTAGLTITAATETTLTGNRALEDWQKSKHRWPSLLILPWPFLFIHPWRLPLLMIPWPPYSPSLDLASSSSLMLPSSSSRGGAQVAHVRSRCCRRRPNGRRRRQGLQPSRALRFPHSHHSADGSAHLPRKLPLSEIIISIEDTCSN